MYLQLLKAKWWMGRTIKRGWELSDLSGDLKKVEEKA